jgi:exopolysaccharide production protein ExoZ
MTAHHRNDNIQVLRFVAASLILMTHTTAYMNERLGLGTNTWHDGEIGIAIFFVISGVVMHMAGMRLSRDGQGARNFMIRRVARILPLYWLFTTIKICIALASASTYMHNRPDWVNSLASYVLFPMFNSEGEIRPLYGVGWTLLHEMFFYEVFSLCLLFRASPLVGSTVVIVGLWGIGLMATPSSAWAKVCTNELNLMFIAGLWLAEYFKSPRHVPAWLTAGIAALAAAIFMANMAGLDALMWPYAHRFQAVLIVLLAFLVKPLPTSAAKTTLVRLGDSSYSLYLFHPTLAPAVCVALHKMHISSPWLAFTTITLSCVMASMWLYRWVESPMNAKARAWLEHLFLTRQTTAK